MADPGIVALLFTDLVGSTAMYDRLGDERAEDLRRGHFAALRTAIASHGGTEVKNLGDGLMVTFPSAVAAVEAAVEIQRAVAAGAGDGVDVAVRIGLHAGEPLLEDGDYFGVSVNIAKRLCDRADAGQILVSDLIRALVSPRARSALHPVGELALKGIEEPVDAYAVEWEVPVDPAAAQRALPPALAVTAGPLVGREVELDAVVHTWKQTLAGEARTLLVSGEPGIGKTRLVAALARRAVDDDPMILVGRCDGELATPLAPFADAFREASLRGQETARRAAADPRLALLLTGSGSRSGLRDADRAEIFDAIAGALHEGASVQPLLLVLEDVHWADEASLLLLRHLLHDAPSRSLVVLTYRDTELNRTHPLSSLLADLRRDPVVERVALRGLSPAAIEVLLTDGATADPDLADLAARIAAETEGNPFFVHEIVRHLAEQGRLHHGPTGWEVVGTTQAIDVPEGVRDVVGRRLGRLSPACNGVLAAASVVGRSFAATAVADVAEVTLEQALDAIDEAVVAHVVEDADRVGSFSFTHALIREVLYLELTTIQRLRLHHRVGELLDRAGNTSEAARHLLEAAPVGDRRRAIAVALRAVSDVTHRLAAYEDAANLCQRALALVEPDDVDLECDLRAALGDAMVNANDFGGVEELRRSLRLARQLRDPDRMTAAITYAVRYGLSAQELAEFADAAREVLRSVPSDATVVRARLRSVLALGGAEPGPPDDVDVMMAEVLEEAVASGDAEAIAYAALARADTLLVHGDPAAAVAVLDATSSTVLAGLPIAAIPYGSRYIQAAVVLADRALADTWLQRVADTHARYGGIRWAMALPRAVIALLEGRLDDAVAVALEIFADGAGEEQASPVLATAARERGEGSMLIPLLQDRIEASNQASWRTGLALFLADDGRLEEAAACAAGALEAIAGELAMPIGLGMLAEVASVLDDADLAARLRPQLEAHRGLTLNAGAFLCIGAAERYLALCAAASGDLDEALDLLEAAERQNERLGATLYTMHGRIDRAELLVRRRAPGDVEQARSLLDRAEEVASASGLARAARRVERLRATLP